MNKKLGIVTLSEDVGRYYKEQLTKLFDSSVEISSYSFESEDLEAVENIDALKSLDIILISTYSQYEIVKNYLGRDFNVVISKLTLSRSGYETLKNLEGVNNAMLVNLSLEMAIETIGLLYSLGIDNIRFTPVFPTMDKVPDMDLAITTGETRYVPESAKKVYDLGHRLIDEMTIVELFVGLGLEEDLNRKVVKDYFDGLISHNTGVEHLLNKSNLLSSQLDTLLSLMEKGLIYTDGNGKIVSFNGSAEEIVKISGSEMVGKRASDVLPQIDFYDYKIKNRLIKINEEYVTVSIYRINDNKEKFDGSYAIVEDFESKENVQNKLRLQLMKKGHVAKYNIDDIVGESDAIKKVKSLIKRMAKSNSPVLVTGESGTGKELVAQSLHNLSNNKNRHFVAVNCAAFNPSLLESELFGYEGGAFTGAMKDGKKGIFEMANNGTIFLDEIGEMPIELQVKLLRVIQEGEIMRVGGSEVIKVNLRIISATNLDLAKEVEKGKFRKDLYYRLNVLPINIPPLRERKSDIELLFSYFKKKNNSSFKMNEGAQRVIKGHRWDGNIRELVSCVLYLDNLDKREIGKDDLPYHIKNEIEEGKIEEIEVGHIKDKKQRIVLQILYEAFLNKEKVGRKRISKRAYSKKYHLTEYDVKGILKELSDLKLVDISIGRGGTIINKKGIKLIEENE
ncbi:MAG: sigma-54 interaction domain-containing protein [Tissierella sp.]|uniref:sigma-54 interaction domain-containing protein n=1 Tax=Tissierella sp. TaxID=41274 RepID=UPI003F9D364B